MIGPYMEASGIPLVTNKIVSASQQDGRPLRRRRVVSSEARKAILEATVRLLGRRGLDSVSVEQVAELAGSNKMSIYRNFGSRELLVQACAELLCEREKARWDEVGNRFDGRPMQQLHELFNDLSASMLADDSTGCAIHLLARSFANESHPVHIVLSLHQREFQERLMRLTAASSVADPQGLADTLMLLWEGATLGFRSNDESLRIALRFPDLSKQIIALFERRA